MGEGKGVKENMGCEERTEGLESVESEVGRGRGGEEKKEKKRRSRGEAGGESMGLVQGREGRAMREGRGEGTGVRGGGEKIEFLHSEWNNP